MVDGKLERAKTMLKFRTDSAVPALPVKTLTRWQKVARDLDALDRETLTQLASDLARAQTTLTQVADAVDDRLRTMGPEVTHVPSSSDWSTTPAPWRQWLANRAHSSPEDGQSISADTRVFHDCPQRQFVITQPGVTTPALALDIFGFQGSFLSLAIGLPDEAIRDLRKTHIIGLQSRIACERPATIFARLNIQHGPNTEKLVMKIASSTERIATEFDLSWSEVNEQRIEGAWLDLIFEKPALNRFEVKELYLYRRPRAEV